MAVFRNTKMLGCSQVHRPFILKIPGSFFFFIESHYCYSFAPQYLIFHKIICHDGYMMFHVHFFSTFIKVAQILGPFDDSLFYVQVKALTYYAQSYISQVL